MHTVTATRNPAINIQSTLSAIDSLKAIALKFSTRSAFRRKAWSAYTQALKMGVLDEVCQHMPQNARKLARKFTLRELEEIASRYHSRTAFLTLDRLAYEYARKHNLLQQICKNMTKAITHPELHPQDENIDALRLRAAKFKSRTSFKTMDPKAFICAKKMKWLDEICKHMQKRQHWDNESVFAEAMKYQTRDSFRKSSPGAYHYARAKNIIDDVSAHMKRLRPAGQDLDIEEIRNAALRYSNKTDFRRNESTLYSRAEKNGILNEVCKHMVRKKKWTDQAIKMECKKYKSKKEFRKSNLAAYYIAYKSGLLFKYLNQ